MVRWLNNITLAFVFCCGFLNAQDESEDYKPPVKDYKNKEQFANFSKRAKAVSNWQIKQLHSGALVVRLKTNHMLIESLKKQGNQTTAEIKKAENFIINKNTVIAFKNNFFFCKVYFIFSNDTDTLLKGARKGIFLDTNLVPDPSIEMNESFYLIAERGYVYNSSIGFVKEDTAQFVKETGTPIKEMGFVIKNKYGHQLKRPFPFYVTDKTVSDFNIGGIAQPALGGQVYLWAPDSDPQLQERFKKNYAGSGNAVKIGIKKHATYIFQARMVDVLQQKIEAFFRETSLGPVLESENLYKPFYY